MTKPFAFEDEGEIAETDPVTLYLQEIEDDVSEEVWHTLSTRIETDWDKQTWLQTPHDQLGGKTPEQVIREENNEKSVLAILDEMPTWF